MIYQKLALLSVSVFALTAVTLVTAGCDQSHYGVKLQPAQGPQNPVPAPVPDLTNPPNPQPEAEPSASGDSSSPAAPESENPKPSTDSSTPATEPTKEPSSTDPAVPVVTPQPPEPANPPVVKPPPPVPEKRKKPPFTVSGDGSDNLCEFNLKQGESNLAEAAPQVVNTLFGKRYNVSDLSALMPASMLATLNFVQNSGTRIFKTRAMGSSPCRNLRVLPTPPADLQQQYDEDTAGNSPERFTLGIFYPNFFQSSDESAIVLRENVDRWTVVHEFMHLNYFTVAKAERNWNDEVLWKRLNFQEYNFDKVTVEDISDSQGMHAAVKLLGQLTDSHLEVLTYYTYEEITIEGQLRSLYNAGKFKYVPKSASENAAWYISSSFEKAKTKLKDLITRTKNFESARAEIDPKDEFGAKAGVAMILDKLVAHQTYLIATVRALLPQQDFSLQRMAMARNQMPSPKPCAHGDIEARRMPPMKSIFDR